MFELPILSFSGEYDFLSNFYPAKVLYEGIEYPTSEHAYQAAKTLDIQRRKEIANMASPGQAKRAGQKVVMREDWEDIKTIVMASIVITKFKDPILAEKLLATGDRHLEEGNTWGDKFWGTVNGKGRNILGLILMSCRQDLQKGEDNDD